MKKIILINMLLFLLHFTMAAQQLMPNVIATAGEEFINSEVRWSWTLGEVAIQTHESGTIICTEGFHQSSLGMSAATDMDRSVELMLFPNPANEQLFIRLQDESQLPISIEVMDARGIRVEKNFMFSLNYELSVSHYYTGSYFLLLRDKDGIFMGSMKFLKF